VASDVFGNFVIQVLFESEQPVIISKLVQIIKPHMVDLSTKPYGCRVVQKAIESLSYEYKLLLTSALEGNIETCSINEHGNHVIQRCIHHLAPHDAPFIYNTIANKTRSLSKDKFGCRVVQKAIETRVGGEIAEPIKENIVIHALEFATDDCGNFVIQKLLREGSSTQIETVVDCFVPHLLSFSCQKVSSNVVETAIEVSPSLRLKKIKRQLLGLDKPLHSSPLVSLIRDRFGRYVVEKLVKVNSIRLYIAHSPV